MLFYDTAMKPFSQLTRREKLIEVLRWLAVLPAAVLGAFVVQFIVRGVMQIAEYGGWAIAGDSNVAYWVRMFLYYVPHQSAFVVAGAKMAPRQQRATAIVLTVVGISLSLLKHVAGQYLVGNRVGRINYTHFSLESAGALIGTVFILWHDRRRRRMAVTE